MTQKKQRKKALSLLLSLTLLFSMAPTEVRAENILPVEYYNAMHALLGAATSQTSGNGKLIFDTGYGPSTQSSSLGGWAAYNGKESGHNELTRVEGAIGTALNAMAPFNGGDFGNPGTSYPGGKPALPWGQITQSSGGAPIAAPTWTGYGFQHWLMVRPASAAGGTEELVSTYVGMDPVMPYYRYTIYKAIWSGNASYNVKVSHLRENGPLGSWDMGNNSYNVQVDSRFDTNESGMAGYKLDGNPEIKSASSSLATDTVCDQLSTQVLSADGLPVGDDRFEVKEVAGKKLVTGEMPNRNVEMKFKYVPDPAVKFRLACEYYDVTDPSNPEQIILMEYDSANHPIGVLQPKLEIPAEYDGADPAVLQGGTRIVAPLIPDASMPKDQDGDAKYVFSGVSIEQGAHDIASGSITRVYGLQDHSVEYGLNLSAVNATTPLSFKWMPNQNVRVRYNYTRNPAYNNKVTIQYRSTIPGDSNVSIADVSVDAVNQQSYTVPIPAVTNYNYFGIEVDDFLKLFQQPHAIVPPSGSTAGSFQFKTLEENAVITVRYAPDSAAMAKVSYYNTAGGALTDGGGNPPGATSHPMTNPGTRTLGDWLNGHGIGTRAGADTPDPGYRGLGWFYANSLGNKPDPVKHPNDPLSGKPTNPIATTDNVTFASGGSYKLIYVYEKDPNEWADLSFAASAHGSVSGAPLHQSVLKGTALAAVAPTPYPAAGYTFEGWYNSAGNMVGTSAGFGAVTAQGSESYTARFVLSAALYDTVMTIPDTDGIVNPGDGSGEIHVNSVNTGRKYAVTDLSGKVLMVEPGSFLESADFTGLTAGQGYYVYELATDQNPATGSQISNVPDAKKSQGALTVIPVASTAPTLTLQADGTAALTLNPANSNTQYALVDENGNVVPQGSFADGWVSPTGGTVNFTGLDPNMNYTLVAQPGGEHQDPAANAAAGYGMLVPALLAGGSSGGTGGAAEASYSIQLLGSGRVSAHTRKNASGVWESLPIPDDDMITGAKAGDKLSISADSSGPHGLFVKWKLLSGTIENFMPANRSHTVTVKGNAVLEANYPDAVPATPSVAVRYAPEDGPFGFSHQALKDIEDELNNPQAPEDITALATSSNAVEYTIKLHKSSVPSSVKGDVKSEDPHGTDPSFSTAWMLDVDIFRKVAGMNRKVPDDIKNRDIEAELFAAMGERLEGMVDYALYEVSGGTVTPVTPDPLFTESSFSGIYKFPVTIGKRYVLAYHKAVNFRVVDARTPANNKAVKLRKGTVPKDNIDYVALGLDFSLNLDNGKYRFKGLSKKQNAWDAFDPELNSVNKDLTVYAQYEIDPDWTEERNKLGAQISIADAIKNNPLLPADKKAALEAALTAAVDRFNQTSPSPSKAEMKAAREALEAAIEEAKKTPGVTPPTPIPPTPTPPTPGGGGGGGGGRGGRGGVSSVSASAGPGLRST
ncbi:MAG: hypothetical protein ACTTK0_10390, partial [Stomatobaculum sp.]